MNIYFAEEIKKLRLEKELTQERLADILSVSPQAVSRWECGTTTPDITLLPVIADYFQVTIEELLGVEQSRKEQKINQYMARFDEAMKQGNINDSIEIARAGVKDFPNNHQLLNMLMYALFVSGSSDGNIPDWKENIEKYKYEIIELGEKILHECTDDDIRIEAKSRLGFHYCDIGEPEKGKEIFKSLPSFSSSREYNLYQALSDTELLTHMSDQIAVLTYHLVWTIWRFAMQAELSDQEKLSCMDKMEQIVCCVFDDDSLDGWYFLLARLYLEGKVPLYLAQNDKTRALDYIEKATHYLEIYEKLPTLFKRKSLLLQYAEYNKQGHTADNRTAPQIFLEDILTKNCYQVLHKEDRFIRSLTRIKNLC